MADRLTIPLPPNQPALLEELKARIQTARLRAVAAANRELIALYFDIGRSTVERQEKEQWGSGVIDRLAEDLRAAFPELEASSPRNPRRVRSFYRAWQPVGSILPQAVAELPWGHNAILLEEPRPTHRRANEEVRAAFKRGA
jgi:predicted nuclease of restriction endonuclease-like (RecB) superfamily